MVRTEIEEFTFTITQKHNWIVEVQRGCRSHEVELDIDEFDDSGEVLDHIHRNFTEYTAFYYEEEGCCDGHRDYAEYWG